MVDYRAYILASDGRIAKGIDLECVDDEEAKRWAEKLVNGHDVELWQGPRKVDRFKYRPQ